MIFHIAIIFALISDMKVEPLLFPVRNMGLRQRTPITYSNRLGLQPINKCNANILRNCPISSHLLSKSLIHSGSYKNSVPTHSSLVPITSKIQADEVLGSRRIFDGDLANIDLKTIEHIKSAYKKTNFKLKLPNRRPIQHLHNVETGPELSTHYHSTSGATILEEEITENAKDSSVEDIVENNLNCHVLNRNFTFVLDLFNRNLYAANYDKFLVLAPALRGENGMSFIQSGLFLEMALMALSTETDVETKIEIDKSFGLNLTYLEKIKLIKQTVNCLPNSTEQLKLLWSSRLVLRPGRQVSEEFCKGPAEALQLKIDHFGGSETPDAMAKVLNKMVEHDSGGAIRDTFEEDDLSGNVDAVLITTLYFRARWRSDPTLLNGTWLFRDSEDSSRTVRMVRINDVMKYVDMPEWDAEALEISYLTEGLSLLMLVPRSHSLKHLVKNVTSSDLTNVTERMRNIRMVVALPLYTLRMTLLLPNKLQAMGITRIMDTGEPEESLRISHAVQRIMFWAEAGRNAFKDDGLEWDEPPELEIVVDRPYIFFVRWRKNTILNGNFVL